MDYRFEWDVDKSRANLAKHGISFDEAMTAFDDSLARIFDDDVHTISERREILIGHSINDRLLLVCFTERQDAIIRIVSARLPTAKERKAYEEDLEHEAQQ